jgi:AcrR family transcriptional regulator
MSEKSKLNPNQTKAIKALLENKTIGGAAEACGLNPRTINRYFGDPQFKTALSAAESEAINKVTRRLIVLADKALDGLESVLDQPAQRGAGNKRLAAQALLDQLVRLRNYHDIEQRITALEMAIYERQ